MERACLSRLDRDMSAGVLTESAVRHESVAATGEPDAGDLPVRFGGRGGLTGSPYPYQLQLSELPAEHHPKRVRTLLQHLLLIPVEIKRHARGLKAVFFAPAGWLAWWKGFLGALLPHFRQVGAMQHALTQPRKAELGLKTAKAVVAEILIASSMPVISRFPALHVPNVAFGHKNKFPSRLDLAQMPPFANSGSTEFTR